MRGNDTREDISVKDRQELFEVKDLSKTRGRRGEGQQESRRNLP